MHNKLIVLFLALSFTLFTTSCDVDLNSSSTIKTSETWTAVDGGSNSGVKGEPYTLEMENGRLSYNSEDYGTCSEGDEIEVTYSQTKKNGESETLIEIFRNGTKITKTIVH